MYFLTNFINEGKCAIVVVMPVRALHHGLNRLIFWIFGSLQSTEEDLYVLFKKFLSVNSIDNFTLSENQQSSSLKTRSNAQ